MKKIILLNVIIALYSGVKAQTGVNFISNLNWQQIQEKAKEENKYIFVDCFATWCGPCKIMDKNVYTNDSVGNFLNRQFISIKVQIDTTAQDEEKIRRWRTIAESFKDKYKINALPTYLFFSPSGDLVHRGIGEMNSDDFIKLAKKASNPKSQYYTLLHNYQAGDKDYTVMPYLADEAQTLDDKVLSDEIASNYIHNYLEKLSESDFYDKPNFEFLNSFLNLIHPGDKVFNIYFNNSGKIDSIIHSGYSHSVINYIVNKQEINPLLVDAKAKDVEPNWVYIAQTIKNKFGISYTEPNILGAKVWWYRSKKQWPLYTKYLVQQVERYGIQNLTQDFFGVLYLNNNAFEVFLYSDNKKELKKALKWVDQAIVLNKKPYANAIDTKASLLYKLGEKQQAIEYERKALSVAPNDKLIKAAYSKMQQGLPTWLN